MFASYKIYPEIGFTYYKLGGKPELTEIIAFYEKLSVDPDFDPNNKGVSDWRGVDGYLCREDVIALAHYVKEKELANGHWVGLVDSPLVTALGEVYSKMANEQHPMDVCSTVERASELLGIDLSDYIEETGRNQGASPL
ncbi:hypothetical protein ACWPKO_01380 [Coraliomargarita sp. W4R53]